MDLGLRQRTRFLLGMTLIPSVGGSISLRLMDGHLCSWQCCISAFGGILMPLMPTFWYLTCCGLVRAAKSLGDEVEQVWDSICRARDEGCRFI
jgi:hypothetical protein